jgi:hypothetical protein
VNDELISKEERKREGEGERRRGRQTDRQKRALFEVRQVLVFSFLLCVKTYP